MFLERNPSLLSNSPRLTIAVCIWDDQDWLEHALHSAQLPGLSDPPTWPTVQVQLTLCIFSDPITSPYLLSLELRIHHQPRSHITNSSIIPSNFMLHIALYNVQSFCHPYPYHRAWGWRRYPPFSSLAFFILHFSLKILPITPSCYSNLLISALLPFISRRF